MQYQGGKYLLAAHITSAIVEEISPPEHTVIWDPFCGGLSMAAHLSEHFRVVCSDVHPALISLYRAVKSGWDPPQCVTEEDYQYAKTLPATNPLHGFCAWGCSFGGKYYGGYARGRKGGFAPAARRSHLRDVPRVESFSQVSFFDVVPRSLKNLAIYCDPPYAQTTGYAGTPAFDSECFLSRCEAWERCGVPVFVSEYNIERPGWVCLWERTYRSTPALQKKSGPNKTDRLYRFSAHAPEVRKAPPA